MSDPALLKQLQIKSGVVRRYVKEYRHYEREAEKQLEKIQQMKADPDADEYVIKKMGEVLQETRAMLPITGSNVRKYAQELQQIITSNAPVLEGSSQLETAKQDLASAEGIS